MGPASAVMERNQYTRWFRVGVKAVGRTVLSQHATEVVQALGAAKGAQRLLAENPSPANAGPFAATWFPQADRAFACRPSPNVSDPIIDESRKAPERLRSTGFRWKFRSWS